MSKAELVLAQELRLSESQVLKFLYAIKSFQQKVPLAYVLGDVFFYGLELKVNSKVLIPRPETEELVDLIVKENMKANSFLDVGTGSGCIPLAIKSILKNARITGGDVSEEALIVAQENAGRLKIDVTFVKLDALELPVITKLADKWDVIVSNPPYIPIKEKEGMDKNVVDHEPSLALFVPNDDPLLFYRNIAKWACIALNSKGKLYFEIHEGFGKAVVELLDNLGFKSIRLLKDLQGKNRMVAAEIKEDTLWI